MNKFKKLIISLIIIPFLLGACNITRHCIIHNPIPFYDKEMLVSDEGTEDVFYYFSTKDYVRNIDTFKKDKGIIITRENGKWNITNIWSLNCTNKTDLKILIDIFHNNIKLDIDEAIPDPKYNITVSIWLISKRVIIMLGPENNDNRELYNLLLNKVNKEITCGR